MHVTKRIDIGLLGRELATAGVVVGALVSSGTDADGDLYAVGPAGNGELIDLPPEAGPVVDAHVAPPPAVLYVRTVPVNAVVRTADGAVRELFRFATSPKHVYRAALEMRATDATDGTTKGQEARLVFKGLASSVVQVGATASLWAAQDAAATGWTIQVQAVGTELVFGVRGSAGRTVDWSLVGDLVDFAPAGLAASDDASVTSDASITSDAS